eukprot:g9171.t1
MATGFCRFSLKRQLVLALLAAAIFTFRERLPAANAQPPQFALRVCEKCVSRNAGNGYNPLGALQQTARNAAEAGWPAPRADTTASSTATGVASEQSVFESQPKQSSAQVSYAGAAAPAAESSQSTFESNPQKSKADTAYGGAATMASEPPRA